jgi:hypothetical protein
MTIHTLDIYFGILIKLLLLLSWQHLSQVSLVAQPPLQVCLDQAQSQLERTSIKASRLRDHCFGLSDHGCFLESPSFLRAVQDAGTRAFQKPCVQLRNGTNLKQNVQGRPCAVCLVFYRVV